MTVPVLKPVAMNKSGWPLVKRAYGVEEGAWAGLFRVGGVAALMAGLVFRRNLDAELLLLQQTGIIKVEPVSASTDIAGWFTLLQSNWLVGLTLLNVFDLVNYALVGLVFFALCVALARAGISRSSLALAATLTFAAVLTYLSSNQAFALLSLSGQYAAATTDAERSLLLAAGQAVLAIHHNVTYGGTGLYLSFLLVSVAGLVIARAMLGSRLFGPATAYTGILANVFGLGYYLLRIIAPAAVALPLSVSAVFLLAWYIQIGCRLLAIVKIASSEEV